VVPFTIWVQAPPPNRPSVGIREESPPPIPLLPSTVSHWLASLLCKVTSCTLLVPTLNPVHAAGVAVAAWDQSNPATAHRVKNDRDFID
jgi:hypothetical protein